MSALEKLPWEVLETIFLHCLNLEMPRASPVIAGKLSSEATFLRAMMAAFGPTWDQYYGDWRIFSFLAPDYDNDNEGDPKLQVI